MSDTQKPEPAQATPPSSWWIGLSREDLGREAAKRIPEWHRQRAGHRDHVGAELRKEGWE